VKGEKWPKQRYAAGYGGAASRGRRPARYEGGLGLPWIYNFLHLLTAAALSAGFATTRAYAARPAARRLALFGAAAAVFVVLVVREIRAGGRLTCLAAEAGPETLESMGCGTTR
jgi:hypothetical protein